MEDNPSSALYEYSFSASVLLAANFLRVYLMIKRLGLDNGIYKWRVIIIRIAYVSYFHTLVLLPYNLRKYQILILSVLGSPLWFSFSLQDQEEKRFGVID